MTAPANPTVEELARKALDGDRDALERLLGAIQGDVHGLAVRMLWGREDARDATQEILVRVATRLSQFDFRSKLRTWVFRVATNYLIDAKKSAVERLHLSFERFGDDLEVGLSDEGPASAERSALTEEVKIGCTLGMLQCLDRPHRLAYVLGEVLELPSDEAAEALEIEPATFRKRLERARSRIEEFARARCGLLSDEAACRCHRRVPAAVQLGRVRPDRLDFAEHARSFEEARASVRQMEEARRVLELYRQSHPRASSVDFARLIAAAL